MPVSRLASTKVRRRRTGARQAIIVCPNDKFISLIIDTATRLCYSQIGTAVPGRDAGQENGYSVGVDGGRS